jgi:predicted NACHT family NTPase
MEEQLQAGTALLLLDALDETVLGETTSEADASYQSVAEAILRLAAHYPQVSIVVTARKQGYQQRRILEGFTELEILDFRIQEIKQFVHNWFQWSPSPVKEVTADNLVAKFERSPRLEALASNPLLLSLLIILYERQLDLPERRAEVYRQCVETLLIRWDESRNLERRRVFTPLIKQKLLALVAWRFQAQQRRYFPESELLELIADFLRVMGLSGESNRQLLAEITAAHGLLKEQAQGWYGFSHLTLQEYFVAHYAVEQDELETLLLHREDPWWEEALLLYAGLTPDASHLMHRLVGGAGHTLLQDDLFQSNLILAGY